MKSRLFTLIVLLVTGGLAACSAAPTATPTRTPTPTPATGAQRTDVTVQQAKDLIASKNDLLILDVRTRSEYDQSHLAGAVLIPVEEMASRLGEVPADRPLLVYCRSGMRSQQASAILTSNGFSVYNMLGGINDWLAAGYPTVK